jgi:hypothetical protein
LGCTQMDFLLVRLLLFQRKNTNAANANQLRDMQ